MSYTEKIKNFYAIFVRFLTLSTPPWLIRWILLQAWKLPIKFQRKFIRDGTSPLLAWRPHYIDLFLPGMSRNDENLKSFWIGEGIREKGITEGWEDVDRIILWIHGGGFRVGHAGMHIEILLSLIRSVKTQHHLSLRILSVGYSLSPEAQYPTAILEILHAYKYLLSTLHIPASKVFVGGDSAGGLLILSAMYGICLGSNPHNLPDDLIQSVTAPAGLILVSPVVAIKYIKPSTYGNAHTDYIPPWMQSPMAQSYIPNGIPLSDPRVCPLNCSPFKEWLPKVLVAIGDKEILRDQILEFVDNARKEGGVIEVAMENEAHDWAVLPIIANDKGVIGRWEKSLGNFIR